MTLLAKNNEHIFAAVRFATGIDLASLRSQERSREVLYARYICAKLLHDNGATMEHIASHLHRTRQGISRSLHVHEQLLHSDYLYRNTFQIASMNAALAKTFVAN